MIKKQDNYDKNIENFVKQMREAGVTDKTINKVLDEIREHQEREIERQLQESLARFRQIAKEAMERDDYI